MRVWDVHPGYLNRQSLLGEHRELHGILSILTTGKTGYARHPETLRWKRHLWAARQRHRLLVAEMTLRGYSHHSPAPHRGRAGVWPSRFIDPPERQFVLLAQKYEDREPGRIPLPQSAQVLWAQHKYSVMARDPHQVKVIGRRLAQLGKTSDLGELSEELVRLLRQPPTPGRLRNALEHMWGYVSEDAGPKPDEPGALLALIASRAAQLGESYLLHSTALSDLMLWVDGAKASS